MTVPLVTVLPAGVVVEAADSESVMAAARRQGLWWPTVCGGCTDCGACWVIVEEGWEHCNGISAAEQARLALGLKAGDSRARLACQLRVKGPVTVFRRSVHPETSERALAC